MTNMNDWNKLMRDRGAIAALEELRAEINAMRHERDVYHALETIDTHIAKYK